MASSVLRSTMDNAKRTLKFVTGNKNKLEEVSKESEVGDDKFTG